MRGLVWWDALVALVRAGWRGLWWIPDQATRQGRTLDGQPVPGYRAQGERLLERIDAGVPHLVVMAQLRAHGAAFDHLMAQVRQACDRSRGEWLLKHTDGRWQLVNLRRSPGDVPSVSYLGNLRYWVHPATLPKPVLRYSWGRAPGFVP